MFFRIYNCTSFRDGCAYIGNENVGARYHLWATAGVCAFSSRIPGIIGEVIIP